MCCGYQHKQCRYDHNSGNDFVVNATTGDVTAMATVLFRMCLEERIDALAVTAGKCNPCRQPIL